MTDIREEVTPATLSGEIRLLRAMHKGSFLIVEGSSDSKLLKKFIDGNLCHLVVALGYDNAVGTIAILESQPFPGALCLVDADFSRILGEDRSADNVIVTDAHDLEAVMIRSAALTKLLVEKGSQDKIAAFEGARGATLQPILLAEASKMGALRLCSREHEWKLDFRNVDFGFVDKSTLKLDLTELVRKILARSLKDELGQVHVYESVNSKLAAGHNQWDLCNGHDMTAILAKGLRKPLGSVDGNEAKPEKVSSWLRLAFDLQDFQETSIHADIVDWEGRNGPYKVLA